MGRPRSLHHRLVLRRVLVGLEKDLVQLLTHWLRAMPLTQLLDPLPDLQRHLLLLFNPRQSLRQDVGRRLAKTPFAGAAKVMGCLKQAQQGGCLLLQSGWLVRLAAEILARQIGKSEFLFRRELPGQLQFNVLADKLRTRQQLGRRWRLETQQNIGSLDLDPLATVELDLRRRFGLGQGASAHEFSGFFKQ